MSRKGKVVCTEQKGVYQPQTRRARPSAGFSFVQQEGVISRENWVEPLPGRYA